MCKKYFIPCSPKVHYTGFTLKVPFRYYTFHRIKINIYHLKKTIQPSRVKNHKIKKKKKKKKKKKNDSVPLKGYVAS